MLHFLSVFRSREPQRGAARTSDSRSPTTPVVGYLLSLRFHREFPELKRSKNIPDHPELLTYRV